MPPASRRGHQSPATGETANFAADIIAWNARRPDHDESQSQATPLMTSHAGESFPAWGRLYKLVAALSRD
ncbi:hypothetical protein NE236_30195 [Actinoallomurus purpureus]|uniref:hypothetical protein n=1 Tax=Actinoallomurus purpureus TaxID=478114 RepID=UPI0020929EA4|nr:hypothetical protein [Actinoallomurus purpureus]MCO6009250.1 hypothetical protein [Actinoallomurus purpureus]